MALHNAPPLTKLRVLLTRHGERRHDPAEGLEHVSGDDVAHAVDGLPDEIVGGDEEAADEAEGGGGAVVQLEERRVDVRLAAAVADLDHARHGHQEAHDRHGEAVAESWG